VEMIKAKAQYKSWGDFGADMRVIICEIQRLLGYLVYHDLISVEECQKINEILNKAYKQVDFP